jgi:hypothetical protein
LYCPVCCNPISFDWKILSKDSEAKIINLPEKENVTMEDLNFFMNVFLNSYNGGPFQQE